MATKTSRNAAAKPAATEQDKGEEQCVISAPRFVVARFTVVGDAPLVIHRFGEKVRNLMQETQEAGQQGRSKKKRDPKDFPACYEDAKHKSSEGWLGIHAASFRGAMIDACRLDGFKMTVGKLAIFVVADGFDDEGTPLVKITKGEPFMSIKPVRNTSGVADLRARPMWRPGWEATVSVRIDLGQLSVTDVANLLSRAGGQCGIGEGRPNSKDSYGCGWGTFAIKDGTATVEG